MFDFTIRRGDERLTKGGAESAVQDGDGQIGEGCLKHPVFNWVRLINMLIGAAEGDPGRRGCAMELLPQVLLGKIIVLIRLHRGICARETP